MFLTSLFFNTISFVFLNTISFVLQTFRFQLTLFSGLHHAALYTVLKENIFFFTQMLSTVILIIFEKYSMSHCCTLLYIFQIQLFKIIFFTNINYNILMFMLFLIVDLYVNENLINLPKSALVLVKSSWGQKLTRKCLHTCNKIIMTRNLLYVMYDMWSVTISTVFAQQILWINIWIQDITLLDLKVINHRIP